MNENYTLGHHLTSVCHSLARLGRIKFVDKPKHIGHHSTQSAMKTFVSPWVLALRFEAKTNFLPSGENIGKPSKVSL